MNKIQIFCVAACCGVVACKSTPKENNTTSLAPKEIKADIEKKSTRGGSFLSDNRYCSGYRVSARMKSSLDTGMEDLGFRCVKEK